MAMQGCKWANTGLQFFELYHMEKHAKGHVTGQQCNGSQPRGCCQIKQD
jgi:hypothetical protein